MLAKQQQQQKWRDEIPGKYYLKDTIFVFLFLVGVFLLLFWGFFAFCFFLIGLEGVSSLCSKLENS